MLTYLVLNLTLFLMLFLANLKLKSYYNADQVPEQPAYQEAEDQRRRAELWQPLSRSHRNHERDRRIGP